MGKREKGKLTVGLGWNRLVFLFCSAGSLVISAYAVCPDITATVTPDLKHPGGKGMGTPLLATFRV